MRALGALSRMKDQAAQQQAILGGRWPQGHFDPGALTALTSAQAQQASDLASFRGSATPEESWALATTLASPQATQARAVEQRAIAAGDGPLTLGAPASQQWRAGMSYTVGWMRHAEQQLTDWITAYAQGSAAQCDTVRDNHRRRGAGRLALVLLVALIIARSLVRPLRRLEAAALDVAGARLPAAVRALSVAGDPEPRRRCRRSRCGPPMKSAGSPGPWTRCSRKRCGWPPRRPGSAPASAPCPPASSGAAMPCKNGCCG